MNTRRVFAAALGLALASAACAQTGVTLVRHAPNISGTVDGSVQQMLGEAVTLNGGAIVTGDLLVPGTPAVRLNGKPSFGGTITGSGVATPTNYQVTLNGTAKLAHLIDRSDALTIPAISTPAMPPGDA